MTGLLTPVLVIALALTGRLRTTLTDRARGVHRDDGASTLELVVIALGLLLVAGIAVAAITAAVTSRTNQIK